LWEVPTQKVGIRVVDGIGEFYLTESDEGFVPRGNNLLFWDETGRNNSPEIPQVYDPEWVRTEFQTMTDLGFNAVRFMNGACPQQNCVTGSNERFGDEYLDNLTEILQIAAEENVFIWLTSNDLPGDSYYAREAFGNEDADFLTTGNVRAYKEYYADFVGGLVDRQARTDMLMAFDIRNEYMYQMDTFPWSMTEGDFIAANGVTYDMASLDDRAALSEEGLVYWVNTMTDVVKSILPDVLVTMTTLTPNDVVSIRDVSDPRWIIVGDWYTDTNIDFHNIHGMGDPGNELEFYRLETGVKPVVTGEYGVGFAQGDINLGAFIMGRWVERSCQAGFQGWLTWHWLDGIKGTEASDAVAPALNPDPCAPSTVKLINRSWGRDATASATEVSELDEYLPNNAFDRIVQSWWSAGGGAPQWIEVDLGEPGPVGRLKWSTGFVTPNGPAEVVVTGRGPNDGDTYVEIGTFDVDVESETEYQIVLTPLENIQFVRFEIRRMVDWVLIHEFEVHTK
jgi:hypothetical protein